MPLVVRKRFLDRERTEPENIIYMFYFAKHLHQPKMFNEIRVFAHYLVIESKQGYRGGSSSDWRFWGFTSKIIHF